MGGSVEQWIDRSVDMHLKYLPTNPWMTLAKMTVALRAFWHHVTIFPNFGSGRRKTKRRPMDKGI